MAKSVFLFVLYGLWVAILFRFSINSETEEILHTITRVLFALAVANLLYRFVDVIGAGYEGIVMNTESKTGKLILPALRKTLRIVVITSYSIHYTKLYDTFFYPFSNNAECYEKEKSVSDYSLSKKSCTIQ